MLNILGMIIFIIILFIIILLLVGIKVSFIYDKKGSEITGCLKILIFKKIKVYSREYPSEDSADEEEEEEEEEEDEDEGIDIKKIIRLAKPCLEDFKIYIKSIFNAISITKIENHLVFGMESYADTGKYIGIIWGILSIINSMQENLNLSAEPSFNGYIFDCAGANEVDVYPLKLIVPTTRLLLKKDAREFIRGVLDER